MSNVQALNRKPSPLEAGAGRQRIVIVGAGGHASELQSYLRDLNGDGESFELIGLVDDNRPIGAWNDSRILGGVSQLRTILDDDQDVSFITAVGDNAIRRSIIERIEAVVPEINAWTLLHPRSIVGRGVEIGEGTCLAPGSIVTTNARIGSHCILNVNASVSHDAIVGDFVNINPGAVVAGNVRVGTGVYVGAGATLIDQVSVGEWSIIGAGAVVIDDIPSHCTAVGVPARVIKHHE